MWRGKAKKKLNHFTQSYNKNQIWKNKRLEGMCEELPKYRKYSRWQKCARIAIVNNNDNKQEILKIR